MKHVLLVVLSILLCSQTSFASCKGKVVLAQKLETISGVVYHFDGGKKNDSKLEQLKLKLRIESIDGVELTNVRESFAAVKVTHDMRPDIETEILESIRSHIHADTVCKRVYTYH